MKKYLISALFTLSLFANGYALTLDQLITEIRIKISDNKSDTNNQHYSSSTLTTRINIVMQNEIAPATLCLQSQISTPTVAEQQEYSFNSDVIAPIRLAYMTNATSSTVCLSTTTAYKKLEYNTIAGLDKNYSGNWESSNSDLPTKYYERGSKYGLHPKPSVVYASTWAVQIDYYKRPDALTTGTDIPFDSDAMLYDYHYLIVRGVMIMCLEKTKDVSALKQEYWALISKMAAEIKTRRDKSGGFSVR